MGWDQLGVLTVGTLVPKGVGTPCFTAPCLSFLPSLGSHRSSLAPQGHNIRAYPMQHVVNKAHTPWVGANLKRRHLMHAGNHKHGTAGHNLDTGWTPKAAAVQVFGKRIPIRRGCY